MSTQVSRGEARETGNQWTGQTCGRTLNVMGSRTGVIKAWSDRLGVTVEEYEDHRDNGRKWCGGCSEFVSNSLFGKDASRYDGLASQCLGCRRARTRELYIPKPKVDRRGRRYVAARDGDKKQARRRVNHLADIGVIPRAGDTPCVDCGDVSCVKRHEFDHYLGYSAAHHESVEVVCSRCHSKREMDRRVKD